MNKIQHVVRHVFILISVITSVNMETLGQTTHQLKIQVDAQNVTHQMKGGIGASWHALIHDIPLENDKYDYPVCHKNPRGSAFAGNPPLADTAAWNQLYKHAKWLGLNFVRLKLICTCTNLNVMNFAPDIRLHKLEKYPELVDNRYDLYLESATLCNQLGPYEKAFELIMARKFHP